MSDTLRGEDFHKGLLFHHYQRADQAGTAFRAIIMALASGAISLAFPAAREHGPQAVLHLIAVIAFALSVCVLAWSWALQKEKALKRRNILRRPYEGLVNHRLPTHRAIRSALVAYMEYEAQAKRITGMKNEWWDQLALGLFLGAAAVEAYALSADALASSVFAPSCGWLKWGA